MSRSPGSLSSNASHRARGGSARASTQSKQRLRVTRNPSRYSPKRNSFERADASSLAQGEHLEYMDKMLKALLDKSVDQDQKAEGLARLLEAYPKAGDVNMLLESFFHAVRLRPLEERAAFLPILKQVSTMEGVPSSWQKAVQRIESRTTIETSKKKRHQSIQSMLSSLEREKDSSSPPATRASTQNVPPLSPDIQQEELERAYKEFNEVVGTEQKKTAFSSILKELRNTSGNVDDRFFKTLESLFNFNLQAKEFNLQFASKNRPLLAETTNLIVEKAERYDDPRYALKWEKYLEHLADSSNFIKFKDLTLLANSLILRRHASYLPEHLQNKFIESLKLIEEKDATYFMKDEAGFTKMYQALTHSLEAETKQGLKDLIDTYMGKEAEKFITEAKPQFISDDDMKESKSNIIQFHKPIRRYNALTPAEIKDVMYTKHQNGDKKPTFFFAIPGHRSLVIDGHVIDTMNDSGGIGAGSCVKQSLLWFLTNADHKTLAERLTYDKLDHNIQKLFEIKRQWIHYGRFIEGKFDPVKDKFDPEKYNLALKKLPDVLKDFKKRNDFNIGRGSPHVSMVYFMRTKYYEELGERDFYFYFNEIEMMLQATAMRSKYLQGILTIK